MSDIDVIVNKKLSLERCVNQINNYYVLPSTIEFKQDYLKQDAPFWKKEYYDNDYKWLQNTTKTI